jgi:release factor glutamine methyltransferase
VRTADPSRSVNPAQNPDLVSESDTVRSPEVAPQSSVAAALVALANLLADPAEAADLLAAALDVPRFWPSLNPRAELTPSQLSAVLEAGRRRSRGAPIQYAVRRAAFRSLTLAVDERVLIPRPETEQLVALVLETTRSAGGGIAVDVGTGAGAIALSLAAEGNFSAVLATDVSIDALAVARENHRRLASPRWAPVEFLAGSLLDPVGKRKARLVVSNPPYIALSEASELPSAVRDWEPPVALFGGADGMSVIEPLVAAAAGVLEGGGWLALEIDSRRGAEAERCVLASGRYEAVRLLEDMTGRHRFVLAQRRDSKEE